MLFWSKVAKTDTMDIQPDGGSKLFYIRKKKATKQLYSSGRMTPPKSLEMKTSNKYSKS